MMSRPAKANCWEILGCGYGPGSRDPCPAATDTTSDGVNDGLNAGRICWTVPGTHCFARGQTFFADKLDACLVCPFLKQVRAEQAGDFRLLKLGQGLQDASDLHATINRIESFLQVPEQLHTGFDLGRLIERITSEAERTVGAQRCVVFLLEGDPPVLRGEFGLRGGTVKVAVPVDESSAVGAAAVRNRVVNLRNPYSEEEPAEEWPTFSQEFDRQCAVRTQSLLAVPIPGCDRGLVGVITAANSVHGAFSPDDQWFLEKYALQVGLAVEKARLLEDSCFVDRLAAVGETMACLPHRLKGITHTLRGLAYIIRQALESERLEDARAACEILDRQVQRIADLSVAIGAYELERRGGPPIGDLNEVVTDAVRVMGEEAEARAVTLEADLDLSLEPCACDRLLVYRCLVNLLGHALHSCPTTGGIIRVTTEEGEPDEAVVGVWVNGLGRDLQAPVEAGALPEGSDGQQRIGWPTAVALAQAHNGRIDIGSDLNQGTLYRLLLPRAPSPVGAIG